MSRFTPDTLTAAEVYGTFVQLQAAAIDQDGFLSLVRADDAHNIANFDQTSATAAALRLRQQGAGPIAKWRQGATDRGFIQNEGGFKLIPAANGRGLEVASPVWDAGRAYGYGNKDGLHFVDNFVDNSGTPTVGGVYQSYTKLWGGTATKNGDGNLDAFWASVVHNGPDEAGLFIGDVTAAAGGSGGNLWGGHFRLTADVAAAMRGLHIDLIPNVDVTSKSTIGLEVSNASATNAVSQALRVAGKFTNPLIVYSDAAGTTNVFHITDAGDISGGHVLPKSNGSKDLGTNALRWRALYVNSVSVNGADPAGGSANINIKNTALAPSGTPAAGGVIYVESGSLKYKGSAGTVTTLAPA